MGELAEFISTGYVVSGVCVCVCVRSLVCTNVIHLRAVFGRHLT